MKDIQLEFRMSLPASNDGKFHEGLLTILEDGELAVQVRATSGHAGHQWFGNYWERGHAPIPPGSYEVDTFCHYSRESKKLAMGTRFFHILPDPVRGPNGAVRTELCLHYDGAGAGTAGCIGVRPRLSKGEPGWYAVLGYVLDARHNGHEKLPLEVIYDEL